MQAAKEEAAKEEAAKSPAAAAKEGEAPLADRAPELKVRLENVCLAGRLLVFEQLISGTWGRFEMF